MLKEYKTLGPYFKEHAAKYLTGFFFLLGTIAGLLIIPYYIKEAVNAISSGKDSAMMEAVGKNVLLILIVAAAVLVSRFIWRQLIQGASRRIESSLRHRIFSRLLLHSASFFNKHKTGDLMARATNDMHAIRMATGMALVTFCDGLFMMTAILVILFTRYPRIAFFTILPLPVLSIIVASTGRVLMKLFKRVQEGFATITEHVQESLMGIRVIKSYVKEKSFTEKFDTANSQYRKANMDLVKFWGLFFPVMAFLGGVTQLVLLRIGGIAVIEGRITAGDFAAIMSYLTMLIWPMIGAGFTINILQRGAASLSRINSVLHEEPEINNPPEGVEIPEAGDIVVRDLTFRYPDSGSAALKEINLTIEKGKTLGILGRTGAGKSTLLKLLPRLLETGEGDIRIGNRDIKEITLNSLRGLFTIVPQDTFLFSDTIYNNIAFAVDRGQSELIHRVGDISTITRDLENFPMGWETEIGERGITLSGGQKQRIAIARALALDAEVLLFDDALSNVDTESEEKILSGMLEFRKGKTNVIISHRISTLQVADRIIVLDKGRIIQQGTHEELIREEGLYGEINAIQMMERVG